MAAEGGREVEDAGAEAVAAGAVGAAGAGGEGRILTDPAVLPG